MPIIMSIANASAAILKDSEHVRDKYMWKFKEKKPDEIDSYEKLHKMELGWILQVLKISQMIHPKKNRFSILSCCST